MKSAANWIYILACLLLLTAGCFGDPPVKSWDYHYGVGSPGTRSESIYGKLLYNGQELPKEYLHVITPIGEYGFSIEHGFGGPEIRWIPLYIYKSGELWQAQNEAKVDQLLSGKDPSFRTTATKEASAVVSTEPYLKGTFEKRPQGVGADWFFVVKQNLWVNPRKIEEVLKTKLALPVGNQ
jgi:hypothetical protein